MRVLPRYCASGVSAAWILPRQSDCPWNPPIDVVPGPSWGPWTHRGLVCLLDARHVHSAGQHSALEMSHYAKSYV